jgi:hypothetical protein
MDERRRRLDREAPGDELARARLLRERMRAGELREDRVLLAATARLPEAQLALGWTDLRRRTPSIVTTVDLSNWVRDVANLDREAGLRAALAASWLPLGHLSAFDGRDDELREAIVFVTAVQRWFDGWPTSRFDRTLIPRSPLGSSILFWHMLALTARNWDSQSDRHPPSGARTVLKVGEFLRSVVPDPVDLLRLAITSAIGEWALRSETKVNGPLRGESSGSDSTGGTEGVSSPSPPLR